MNPQRSIRTAALLAAVSAVPVFAGVTNDPSFVSPGIEYVVSTSGATALGGFTRAGTPTSYIRGANALGQTSLRIGRSVYTIEPAGQYIGIANLTSPFPGEPTVNNDRIVYKYHERGSVQGVLDLIDNNGLLLPALTPRRQADPQTANPLWIMGNRFTAPNTGPTGGYTTGANFNNAVNPPQQLASPTGQETVRIGWTDVKFEQVFAIDGTGAVNRRPLQPGYGAGLGNMGSTNFQRFRSANVIDGGIAPSTTRLRNESLAVIPFTLNANPGTGLARVTKEEGAWLQAAGRLPNGADFNVVTRDAGSGTRNQGANNLGIDPTWGAGERDRRALASFIGRDANGVDVQINPGDEADTRLSLTGSQVVDLNESRVGPSIRFADKASGSTGVMPTVRASRMAAGGIVSAADTGASGTSATSSTPVRAIAIEWQPGGGYYTATARNVTEGLYEMWSASVAVTVAPYANPTENDTAGPNGRPIAGDQIDHAGSPGIHRKWLDNITGSAATFGADNIPTNTTPADGLLLTGYILTQLMGVTKEFDGDVLTSRTRSTTPAPGNQFSEQQIWELTVNNPNSTISQATNWRDPGTHNGGLAGGSVRYNLYAPTNTLATADANADISIRVNGRTNLAGDLNNDGVRDIQDTAAFARAYAAPASYLALFGSATTNANSTANDGSSINSTVVTNRAGGLINTTLTPGEAGLLVLTDLNSDGNVKGTPGNYTTTAVDREDVRYFLFGAAVDTSAYNVAATVQQNGQTVSLTPAQNRRENGVRAGPMRKNLAISQFNAAIDDLVIEGVISPTAATSLKFNPFDVNGDDIANFYDAKLVFMAQGKRIDNLQDQLDFFVSGSRLINQPFHTGKMVSLVAPELNDDGVINMTDFNLIQPVVRGDFNLDGVRNAADIAPFVLALTDTPGYLADKVDMLGSELFILGDFNGDGMFNAADIAGFVQLLVGGGFADDPGLSQLAGFAGVPIPEPGGLAVLAVGGLLLRRRRVSP